MSDKWFAAMAWGLKATIDIAKRCGISRERLHRMVDVCWEYKPEGR